MRKVELVVYKHTSYEATLPDKEADELEEIISRETMSDDEAIAYFKSLPSLEESAEVIEEIAVYLDGDYQIY